MSTLLKNGKINQVFYPYGDGFIRAPFVTIEIGGHECLMPMGQDAGMGLYDHDDADDAFYMGRGDFGLFDLDPVVVGEHEMGAVQGPDNWKSLHAFSMI